MCHPEKTITALICWAIAMKRIIAHQISAIGLINALIKCAKAGIKRSEYFADLPLKPLE
jgi:hypothetical protein